MRLFILSILLFYFGVVNAQINDSIKNSTVNSEFYDLDYINDSIYKSKRFDINDLYLIDNEFYFECRTDSGVYLNKIDKKGKLIWYKEIGKSNVLFNECFSLNDSLLMVNFNVEYGINSEFYHQFNSRFSLIIAYINKFSSKEVYRKQIVNLGVFGIALFENNISLFTLEKLANTEFQDVFKLDYDNKFNLIRRTLLGRTYSLWKPGIRIKPKSKFSNFILYDISEFNEKNASTYNYDFHINRFPNKAFIFNENGDIIEKYKYEESTGTYFIMGNYKYYNVKYPKVKYYLPESVYSEYLYKEHITTGKIEKIDFNFHRNWSLEDCYYTKTNYLGVYEKQGENTIFSKVPLSENKKINFKYYNYTLKYETIKYAIIDTKSNDVYGIRFYCEELKGSKKIKGKHYLAKFSNCFD